MWKLLVLVLCRVGGRMLGRGGSVTIGPILLGATLCACWGNMRPPDPVEPFVGDWDGTFSIVIGNDPPRVYDAPVHVEAAQDDVAAFNGLCSSGDSVVDAILAGGFDNRVLWRGTLECLPVTLDGCFTYFTFASMTAEVDDVAGTMTITAEGAARDTGLSAQCKETKPLILTFTGTKRGPPQAEHVPTAGNWGTPRPPLRLP